MLTAEPGRDRRGHRGERPEDRHDRVHQRVGEADRIDPGLGRRDQERDRRPLGRALAPEAQRGRQHAAGAERQRRADHRPPEHRADLAGAEETHQGPRRHHHREDAREREAEQQEDCGFLDDPPGLDRDLEQEVDHRRPLRDRLATARGLQPVSRGCRYCGRYFFSIWQATEYCGSTTLATSSRAAWPRSCSASYLS